MQSPALGAMRVTCCSCRPQLVASQRWQPLPVIAAAYARRTAASSRRCSSTARHQESSREAQSHTSQPPQRHNLDLGQLLGSAAGMWLLTELPAFSEEAVTDFSQGSFSASSYYVTLGLFLLSLPGAPISPPPEAGTCVHCAECEGLGEATPFASLSVPRAPRCCVAAACRSAAAAPLAAPDPPAMQCDVTVCQHV